MSISAKKGKTEQNHGKVSQEVSSSEAKHKINLKCQASPCDTCVHCPAYIHAPAKAFKSWVSDKSSMCSHTQYIVFKGHCDKS